MLDLLYFFEGFFVLQDLFLGFVLRDGHDHFFAVGGFDSAQRLVIGKGFTGATHAVLQHADALELLGFHLRVNKEAPKMIILFRFNNLLSAKKS